MMNDALAKANAAFQRALRIFKNAEVGFGNDAHATMTITYLNA